MIVDYYHDPVCCALNRGISFPGPGPGPGPGTGALACCCCDLGAKLEAGSAIGARVGRRNDVRKGGALLAGVCGGNNGE